ncbi:MAG: FxsA family protein [Beijerinckiaceae bacterium]|nr:FxsA family protein [Beijerinckiaceae bacterium]
MRGSTKLLLLIVAWFSAELIVLSLLVKAIGWMGVLILGAVTTLTGFLLIRSVGRKAVQTLQAGMRQGGAIEADVLGGSLRAIGAILLILPGFLTDAIGLALSLPMVSAMLRRKTTRPGPARDGAIDLDRGEWRPVAPEPPERIGKFDPPA